MIEFQHVSKYFHTPHGRKVLLDNFSMVVPAGSKVALMGRNGAGKSTMIGMISGTVSPNSGRIRRTGTMSWPLGFSGSFASDITGRQNALFVARIYGVDSDRLLDFVQEFSDLDKFFDMPVRSYSSGMRARLAFGLSMGLGFDWYLVDEITAVGDASFRKKSLDVFRSRLADAGLLMVSHSPNTLRDYCTSGIVLEDGNAIYFHDIEDAIRQHELNMETAFSAELGGEGKQAAQLQYNEARRYYQNGDYLRAGDYLSRALAERPDEAAWQALLGEINRKMGAHNAAIDAYHRALDLQNEPRYRIALAQVLASVGRNDETEQELRAVMEMDPGNNMATYLLGRKRYRDGSIEEAEQLLQRTIVNDPNNAAAHRILAQINDARGNYPIALVHHAEAARLLPENTNFLLGYARCQYRNADHAGAKATYLRILALTPDNEAAQKGLAQIA